MTRETFEDRLFTELDNAQQDAIRKQPLVEPNEDEKRNGWTAETLTAYVAGRRAASSLRADPHSLHRRAGARPITTSKAGYRPKRWRG